MYGRARRIEFAKKVGYTVLAVFVAFVVFNIVKKGVEIINPPERPPFSDMKDYFISKGYHCQRIENDGGKCYHHTDNGSISFFRYNDGFHYISKGGYFSLEIRHMKGSEDEITFKTNDTALKDHKNKVYSCKTDNSVIGDLKNCIDEQGNKLELNAYLGIVESGIDDLNRILKYSGFDVNTIIKKYEWEKK